MRDHFTFVPHLANVRRTVLHIAHRVLYAIQITAYRSVVLYVLFSSLSVYLGSSSSEYSRFYTTSAFLYTTLTSHKSIISFQNCLILFPVFLKYIKSTQNVFLYE